MNGDIILEARWHRRSASKAISPFIIFAVFDVSFRRYKTTVFFTFIIFKTYMSINQLNNNTT